MKEVLFLLFACGISLVSAQSDTTLFYGKELSKPVIVTAQRSVEYADEAPTNFHFLNEAALENRTARSLAEALIGTPGVWMQKTNHGGGSPFLRGMTGNQVLLLLDGIRLNNSTYRFGPNQYFNTVDPFSLQQVEVVLGAGSVLYGSDALGGTVNLLSRTPKFSSNGWKFNPSILLRARNSDMEYTGRANLSASGKKLAFQTGFSWRDFGTLVGGGDLGELVATAYDERAFDAKLLLATGSNSQLTIAYNGLVQTDVGRYDQVAQRGYDFYDFDPQERQMAYLRWENEPSSNWIERLEWTSAWQYSREVRKRKREESTSVRTDEDRITTLSSSALIHTRFSTTWTAVSGAELYYDDITSASNDFDLATNTRTNRRGLYPAVANALNVAIFSSHQLQFDHWKIQGGLRYNPFRLWFTDPTFGDTDIRPSAIVGDLAINHYLNRKNVVHLALRSGFRAPNINDLSSFGSFDFGVEVPSTDLASERNFVIEVGYETTSDRFGLQTALFRNRLFDLIERTPSTFMGSTTFEGQDVYKKVNVSEATIYGGELGCWAQIVENLLLSGQMSYTYGESAGRPMRRIPPLNGRLALSYQVPLANPEHHLDLSGAILFATEQTRLSGGDISDHRIADGGTPGWAYGRLRAAYSLKNWRVALVAENINNAAYRIHGSGVDGAGRHLVLEVAWKLN